MKLKTQLIIIFFAILIIPLSLTLGLVFLFNNLQTESLVEKYGFESATNVSLPNSLQIINATTKSVYDDLYSVLTTKQTLEGDPQNIENLAYWAELNRLLLKENSFLVVRKGETVIYSGLDASIDIQNFDTSSLPEFDIFLINSQTTPYILDECNALVKQLDFYFSDDSRGSFFIVTPVSELLPQLKTLFIQIIVSVFVILLATCISLMIWIYRSITIPLGDLKEATQNIRNGNMDFKLSKKANREFKDLCSDFEAMRLELQQSQQEKVRYDKENRELISNISHDLKTPITAIKGYCEGIIDGVADTPEKLDKYIKTIYNKSVEMNQLINELTFYSKVDTNKLPYDFQKLNVSQFFDDCIQELRIEMDARNIELSFRNHISDSSVILGDAQQLHRVINNIISNSVKYMDKPKGFIDIVLREDDTFVSVEIIDNGRGISPEALPHVFDRFYRADTSRNTKEGGSGIGLSIVRKIIEDHGGQAAATSIDGEGTTIYFTLKKLKEAL
jgi:signal transduction histidine kinase